MKSRLLILVFVIFLIASCQKETQSKVVTNPLFKAVENSLTNISFSNNLTYQDNLNIIDYLYYYNGGGVAIGDINNDGLDDVFFTANQGQDQLYINKGNLVFEDVTKKAGILLDKTWSTGVTMEDLNNDGFLDIVVSKVGIFQENSHNQVYLNNGNTTFTESSKKLGLYFKGFSTQTAFLDYDNDGDLDLYLLNHSVHSASKYGKSTKRQEKDSISGDRFYENKLNEGTFYFEDVTDQVGIYSSGLGYGLGINASDLNGDGLTDIYVSNDFHENDYIYINTGYKTFVESSEKYLSHSSRFSMGMDVGDLNQDNLPDIFTLDMMPYDREIFLKSAGEDTDKVTQIKNNFGYQTQYARNSMQINKGTHFADMALITKTHATDWSWSALIQDFDNDGLNDVFITNGIYKRPNDLDYINYLSTKDFANYANKEISTVEQELINKMPTVKLPNVLFKNKGNYEFEKLTEEIGLTASYSNGAAFSDLDNDGDLDLVVNNINEEATVLQNNSSQINSNNFVEFNLKSFDNNSHTTGAKIKVFTNPLVLVKQLTATHGFQSSSSRKVHFGLGKASKVDSVQIEWPNQRIETLKNIEINKIIDIQESKNTKPKLHVEKKIKKPTIFPYIHFENDYFDYVREPLIPEKLSQEGPATVYADLTGDGIKDLYLGGARYKTPSFYKGLKNGEFAKTDIHTFNADEKYEDVDAVAFDLENDGDLDLYVQSGGNDHPEGDPLLEDRIYINQGNGTFERIKAQLPATNGGSVSAGDYNNDGFQDLFIGSRSVPGAYGNPPVSLILKNSTRSSFTVVAQDKMGMVTDSKWADLNGDGYLDLIVVGDWMPITVLLNQKDGKFKYSTPKLGLSNTAGLWNTVELIDVDKNGTLDILAGNVGENFKWQASAEQPVKLYVSDFDANEQVDPIIFYPLYEQYVPFANKTMLTAQMPYLAKKFTSYAEFAKVTGITSLTGKPLDSIPIQKEIHELKSMIYLNINDSLIGKPLPKEVQASVINDFEINKDNILYVGNYKKFVTELGNSDANSGGSLSSFKKENFTNHVFLNLPKDLDYRKIIHLENDTFLIVSNNGNAYIIEN